MKGQAKLFAGLAMVTVLAWGANAGFAAGLLSGGSTGHTPRVTAAAAGRGARPMAIGDGTNEDVYTPIAPCRVVDTRRVGPILKGTARSFHVRGTTGFPGQGGHTGGCNVPNDAVAASLTVTSLDASATGGVLRVYAAGTPKPTTVFTAIDKPLTLSSGGTVGLCVPTASCGGAALTVAADFASADVLIDVTGYYRTPIYAHVGFDGTLLSRSDRVLSARRISAGSYTVEADRDISTCAYVVTPTSRLTVQAFSTAYRGDPNGVEVDMVDQAGTFTDSDFSLAVTC